MLRSQRQGGSEEKATDHIGVKEVGDDDIGGTSSGFRKKSTVTRKIKNPTPMDGCYWNSFFCELRSKFPELAKSYDTMLKFIQKERERPEEHVFTSSAIE